MALSRVQEDLDRYAQEKLQKFVRDVLQSFQIADESQRAALGCIHAQLLRMASTLAIHADTSRVRWLKLCADVYDMALEAHNEVKGD